MADKTAAAQAPTVNLQHPGIAIPIVAGLGLLVVASLLLLINTADGVDDGLVVTSMVFQWLGSTTVVFGLAIAGLFLKATQGWVAVVFVIAAVFLALTGSDPVPSVFRFF